MGKKLKLALVVSIVFGLMAVVGAIVAGSLTFDGTVTEAPYETGLLWDQIRHEKSELGWNPRLTVNRYVTGRNRIVFTLSGPSGVPVPTEDVIVEAGRIDTNQFNRVLTTCRAEAAAYECDATFPVPGRWEFRFRWKGNPEQVYFVRSFEVVGDRPGG